MASADTVRFRMVENEESFFALRPDWDRLHGLRQRRSVEMSFPWISAAWEKAAREEGRQLAIIVGQVGNRVVLVFPLVLQRLGPFRIAHGLGPDLHESSDALVEPGEDDKAILAAAWDYAKSKFHLFRFLTVRMDAQIWPVLEKEPVRESQPMRAPFLDCERWPDWDSYYSSRTRSFKNDCRKSVKRLMKAGELRYQLVETDEHLNATLSWMFDRKIEWFERTGREASNFARRTDFYRRACEEAFGRGEVVLIELVVDATLVAGLTGISPWGLPDLTFNALEPRWHECGPGRVLMLETVHWAFEHSIRYVDLGPGVVEPKYRLTDTDVEAAYLLYVAPSAAGYLLFAHAIYEDRTRACARSEIL